MLFQILVGVQTRHLSIGFTVVNLGITSDWFSYNMLRYGSGVLFANPSMGVLPINI